MFELLLVAAGAFVVDEPPNTNGLGLAVALFVLDEPNIEPVLAVLPVLEPNIKGFGSVLTAVVDVDEDAPKPEPNTLELLVCPNTDPEFSFCLLSAGLSLLVPEKANSEGAVLLGAVDVVAL